MAGTDPVVPDRPRVRLGVVVDYDAERGEGIVGEADGVSWWFHCTAVADGSRQIDSGVAVAFAVAPGRRGRWEAVDVTPTGTGPATARE